MSIFLVGGGPDTVSTPVIFDQFIAEARHRTGGGRPPRIAVVLAAQAGTLGRAVAAVVHGMVDKAVAIDENTALVLPHAVPGEQRAIGTNNCWLVRGPGHKAAVSVLGSVITRG